MSNAEITNSTAINFLEHLAGSKSLGGKADSDVAVRQKWFDALAQITRLLVVPEYDDSFKHSKGHVDWSVVPDEWRSDGIAVLEKHRSKLADAGLVALGIHVIDSSIGRHSNIWASNEWLKRVFPQNRNRFFTWNIYTDLWLKSYWSLLQTDTTLINAFHENVLFWDGRPIKFSWNESETAKRESNVCHLRYDKQFVASMRELTEDFQGILLDSINGHTAQLKDLFESWKKSPSSRSGSSDARYRAIINSMLRTATEKANKCYLVEELRAVASEGRNRILLDEDIRNSFVTVLKSIDPNSKLATEVESQWENVKRSEIRGDWSWEQVGVCVQSFQSCIMNEFSFCNGAGFWVDRIPNQGSDEFEVFLILGFETKNDVLDIDTYRSFRQDFEKFVLLADNKTKIAIKASRTDKYEPQIVDWVNKYLPEFTGKGDGPHVWLGTVSKLAERAVHEGNELEFVLGFGAKHLAQVNAKQFEPPPPTLVGPDAEQVKVAHFLKSYFSLFGDNVSRISWFDLQGQFAGVYESPIHVHDMSWIEDWSNRSNAHEQYLIAKITGKSCFDILAATRPLKDTKFVTRFRVVNGKASSLTEGTAIEEGIKEAVKRAFPDTDYKDAIEVLAQQLTTEANKTAHGTSFVFVDKASRKRARLDYRIGINDQLKSLTAELSSFSEPVLTYKALASITEKNTSHADAVCELASPLMQLDGATVVEVSKEGLKLRPAQQIIPLVMTKAKSIEVLDFFKPCPDRLRATKIKLGKFGRPLDRNTLDVMFQAIQTPEKFHGNKEIGEWMKKINQDRLSFLNSAGTRHHSLWGISITAKEPLFTIALSEDGSVRVFWAGQQLVEFPDLSH